MHMNKLKNIPWIVVFGFFLVTTTSCVEKYWPVLSLGESFLVVDGGINNFPGPYTIKLSYSSSLTDTLFIPISSARVSILDDRGNEEILIQNSPGIYKTSSLGIQGIIGRSYKVSILLENGETYESELEELLEPINVEELIAEEEWQYAQNILEVDQEGLRFNVKTKANSTSNTYLIWEIEETYEYHSVAPIMYYYDGSILSEGSSNNFGLQRMKNMNSLFCCWKTETLSQNFHYSFENMSSDEAHQIPLHFIPYGDKRLRYGYNIQVNQFVISKDAYTFINELEKQNENQGTLFTTQPFQIKGNILNTLNPSEIVLGYFKVASGSLGPRIQVRAPWRRYKRPICYTLTSDSLIHNFLISSNSDDWPLYFTDYPFENPMNTLENIIIFAYVAPSCVDCTRHGGTTNKPYFWEEWNKAIDYSD